MQWVQKSPGYEVHKDAQYLIVLASGHGYVTDKVQIAEGELDAWAKENAPNYYNDPDGEGMAALEGAWFENGGYVELGREIETTEVDILRFSDGVSLEATLNKPLAEAKLDIERVFPDLQNNKRAPWLKVSQ